MVANIQIEISSSNPLKIILKMLIQQFQTAGNALVWVWQSCFMCCVSHLLAGSERFESGGLRTGSKGRRGITAPVAGG